MQGGGEEDRNVLACHMCGWGKCSVTKAVPIDSEYAPVIVKFINFEVLSRWHMFDGTFEIANEGRSAVDLLTEWNKMQNTADEIVRITINIQELKITTFYGFMKRLNVCGLNPSLPKYPFIYYFESSVMRYMPLTSETYEHAIAQIPRDGNAVWKLWLLVSKGTIDETLPSRRRNGCGIRNFCQNCIEKVPATLEELYCKSCTEHLNDESKQTGDTPMEPPDWE
jgi:hypothetical protein